MSRLLAVAGLALRELWVSFRLLLVVAAALLSALPAALVSPGPLDGQAAASRLAPYSVGLAVTLALAAGVAAGSLAAERGAGTAGWLVSRAVPRSVIVGGWFAALAVVLLIGMLPSAVMVWLTFGQADVAAIDPVAYASAIGAAWATGMVAVALGLLLGSLLGTLTAAVLALLASGLLLVPVALGLLPALAVPPVPAAAFASLAELPLEARPIADALRSGGLSLAVAGGLLVLAMAAMQRADL